MSFKHPSYADKSYDLHANPEKQVIQGIVCWALGYPPLDHEVNKRITPTQFQRVQSLRAGTGTGAISVRLKNKPNLKSLNPEDK